MNKVWLIYWKTLYSIKDAVASTKNPLERGITINDNNFEFNDNQMPHSHFKVCHIETNLLL